MVRILENKRDVIERLCTHYGVLRLEIFGSALTEEFDASRSDLDLLVDFSLKDPYERAEKYFEFLDQLRDLLGVEIDLVMVGAVKNKYIAADINRTKQVFYAA